MPAAPMTDGAVAAGLKIDMPTRKAMRAQAGLMQGVNQVPQPDAARAVPGLLLGLPAPEPRAPVCRAA